MPARNAVSSATAARAAEYTAARGLANGLLLSAIVWIGLGYVAWMLR